MALPGTMAGSANAKGELPLTRLAEFINAAQHATWKTSFNSMDKLLSIQDEDRRDELTIKWRDYKLQELNFVGITVNTQNRVRTD